MLCVIDILCIMSCWAYYCMLYVYCYLLLYWLLWLFTMMCMYIWDCILYVFMYKCMFSAVLVRKGVILRRLIALHDPLYVYLHCLTCMTDCSPDIICIILIHSVFLFGYVMIHWMCNWLYAYHCCSSWCCTLSSIIRACLMYYTLVLHRRCICRVLSCNG